MNEWRSALVGALAGLMVLSIGWILLQRPSQAQSEPLPKGNRPVPKERPEAKNPESPPLEQPRQPAVVDSAVTLESAMKNQRFPNEIVGAMALVDVDYLGFDGKLHRGQIVVHQDLAMEVKSIFDELLAIEFPIEKVIPIAEYGWDDARSIADNNTSAFNYRKTITPAGQQQELSQHSYGRAIDLNPYLNPYVNASGRAPRPYNPEVRGTLVDGSAAVGTFLKYGWEWGGHWKGGKDYQHFVKKAPSGKLN